MTYTEYLEERYAICCESPTGLISKKTGKPVGSLNKRWGYWYLTTAHDGIRKNCRVHRLIWLMAHGELKEGMVIDHINRISSDNRLENLREVTQSDNQINTGHQHNNKLGLKNISYCKARNRYRVQFTRRGIMVYSPRLRTLEEAINWRDNYE